QLDCLSTLVQAGASVTTVTSRYAQTPAHIAAFGGHQHCLLWLLRVGANVNQQDYLGETPLHKAARSGSEECVHLLVACGAQVEVPNHSGITPLELAISQGFSRPAAFLANELARRRGDAGG
uniref:Uncharacterized protein n=1 Tax=Petromyzon marinus TaxID=7757 RepID=S4RHK6_PETMA